MANKTVIATGLDESIASLEQLGRQGDQLAHQAATEAAGLVRDNYLINALSSATGLSRSLVRDAARIKKASNKYPYARVNFSGAGIPVTEYEYDSRVVNARNNRAQILVKWLGGTKVAAGFINPNSSGRVPLSTRNQKTVKGRTYTYRKGVLTDAMGPSLAAVYQSLPEAVVESQANSYLSERLTFLLDQIIQ